MKSMCRCSEINVVFCVGIVDIQIDIQNIVYSADTDSKVVKSKKKGRKSLMFTLMLIFKKYFGRNLILRSQNIKDFPYI